MSTEVLSKTKKEIEMVTIPKSEYEELKEDSRKWNDYVYDGERQVKETLKNLKKGGKLKEFKPIKI